MTALRIAVLCLILAGCNESNLERDQKLRKEAWRINDRLNAIEQRLDALETK